MTQAKKLKRAVRRRALKTGESYTAARKQVLEARRRGAAAPAAPPPPSSPAPPARARRTTSDAPVRKATGHGFDHWFAVLDAFGAAAKGHTASARHLSQDHGVPGWHCQMITVEYERARGLRAANQNAKGDFQVSVTRTLPIAFDALTRALEDPRRRKQWLKAVDGELAGAVQAAFAARGLAARPHQQAQMRFPWAKSRVMLSLAARPGGKTSIVAANEKLAGPADVERRRQLWTEAFAALKSTLEE
jgi:hypothetical protein